jgi:16S rRNA (cytosine1402-N4)-methyltransferase
MLKGGQRRKPVRSKPVVTVDSDYLDVNIAPDEWSINYGHMPVLLREAIVALDVKANGFYVDLTLGGGGHSRLILSRLGSKGRLLALDKDPDALAWAAVWGQGDKRLILKRSGFDRIDEVLAELKLGPADGLLADLGLSSRQLLGVGRGFSWLKDEPLDMRMDPDSELTAYEVVNAWPEEKLLDLIRYKAEERSSHKITKTIVAARAQKPVETTGELAELVSRVLRRKGHQAHSNPATKVFMGLRLAVNQEMEALATLLKKAPGCLNPGGRMVVISFHSLEDRQVKRTFQSREGHKIWENLFKKPIVATGSEIDKNRRARSAKLRVARLIDETNVEESNS